MNTELTPTWQEPGQLGPIKTQEEFDRTLELTKAAKAFQKMVGDWFAPLKKKAHEAHKSLTTREAETLLPAKKFEAEAKALMVTFQREQERIRQEEERRLREEALKREEEARLAEALHLEKMGASKEEVDAVINEPIAPPPIVVPKVETSGNGASIRKVWKWKPINISVMNRRYLVPDKAAIDKIVASLGPEAAAVIGGIEVYPESSMSIRT